MNVPKGFSRYVLGIVGVLSVAVLMWLGVQLVTYGGIVTRRYATNRFEVIDSFPLINIVRMHADHPRLLICGGVRFDKLQGSFPYFVDVPQLDSILFATKPNGHSSEEFVVLNLRSGKTSTVPFKGMIVGTYGLGRRDKYSITLKSVDGEVITLQDSSDAGREYFYRIDIAKGTIMETENVK